MEVMKRVHFVLLWSAFAFTALVESQDQSGFISIDCGIDKNSSYTDNVTGIYYVSDSDFINTGVNGVISSKIGRTSVRKQYLTLRSFPEGAKSCYTLKPAQGRNNKYLIRAGFLYGNYDKKGYIPRFYLYLGANWWDTVALDDESSYWYTEIVHVPLLDYMDVCLVDIGLGTPFISVLELRPLDKNIYVTEYRSLKHLYRFDYGSTSGQSVRFPDDVYDRIWSSYYDRRYQTFNVSSTIDSTDSNFSLPSVVMETAGAPASANISMLLNIARNDPNTQFYVYLYFAEIQVLNINQSREFNIYRNGEFWVGPVTPKYLQTTIINSNSTSKNTEFTVTIRRTPTSNLPPLLNAMEVYFVEEFLESETYQQDIEAIMNIKSTYTLMRHWQGDPCGPDVAVWEGLNCSYNRYDPPRIVSLNLSSSGLTGPIAPSISNLTMLQYLDLSNNSLTGPVPDFLSQLQFLRVLNLDDNELSGPMPQVLRKKSNNGSLSVSMHRNIDSCSSHLCKQKFIVPLVATIAAVTAVLLSAYAIFWGMKRKNQGSISADGVLRSKDQQFTYSEILDITNNLERVLGSGNSGKVYHGYFEETPVAVKIFSPSHALAYKHFQADGRLVTRVTHRHLTASFGYFDDGNNKGLIYEFFPNGSFQDILTGRNTNLLSWQERIQIAMDIAQGLHYLHNSCNPPIIHGNLKPTNILLNENYQAKLVDFGLSKIFTIEAASKEYLDPEYYVTNKLTERSDVYSFGLVLLEIVTNKSVRSNSKEKHLSQWVKAMLGTGDIKRIVDPRLEDDFFIDSAWKAVEIAMACVSPISRKRPPIRQVAMELNQCLAMEITRISRAEGTIEMVTVNLGTSEIPEAR